MGKHPDANDLRQDISVYVSIYIKDPGMITRQMFRRQWLRGEYV